MKRVVILGRGAAGKSAFANRLGAVTRLPVIALDEWFWQPGLVPRSREGWVEIQRKLIQQDSWIIDGDLGPDDVLAVRLQPADTVIVLDFSLVRCTWRAIRRSRERADFWRWLWGYRRRSLPAVSEAIATYAPEADVHVLRNPRAVEDFIADVTTANR